MNVLHPRATTVVVQLALTFSILVTGTPAPAQPRSGQSFLDQDRGAVQRVIHGKVEDKGGAPIKGAVVYLQDSRSSSVRSAITGDDGTYRFVQLSQSTDYQLWAKLDTRKSKIKSISSFDSKNDFNIDLKIDD